ncbi:hypothetical protein RhiirA4_456657 [Rhizophagus irregularis]|uniref:MIR domain-containing protein n=1 Tax=Rhizophagus irregularis TaxID=588596 RepID=A0A2I1G845_9GLOM|nr:hypothetical protein RhiirA4_456657 [Rhizophagus irregularis]
MDFPKYNGNVHPDEWIKDLQNYLEFYKPIKDSNLKLTRAKFALSLVDSNILLPTEIDSIVKLRKALKEDISFTIFKNTNKRKLQSLNYIPESMGGDTSKFISNFLKLCYNAEINDIEEQKNYLYKSFTMNTENLCYTTGSQKQLGVSKIPNSLWKIKFVKELITYSNTSKILQHVKSSNKFLGIDDRFATPSTNHTEVSSCNDTYHCWYTDWKFNHTLRNSTKTDKLNFYVVMIFNLLLGIILIKKVVCHNERLGGNDEWCIEHIWTIDNY